MPPNPPCQPHSLPASLPQFLPSILLGLHRNVRTCVRGSLSVCLAGGGLLVEEAWEGCVQGGDHQASWGGSMDLLKEPRPTNTVFSPLWKQIWSLYISSGPPDTSVGRTVPREGLTGRCLNRELTRDCSHPWKEHRRLTLGTEQAHWRLT